MPKHRGRGFPINFCAISCRDSYESGSLIRELTGPLFLYKYKADIFAYFKILFVA